MVFYHFGIGLVSGGVGVLMFFVLSGFLITWLLLKEDAKYGDISLRDFYVRRTLRIFPAFYFYALFLIGFLVFVEQRYLNWPQTLAALLYVNNYYQAITGDPNTGFSHTWSLGIEEQFYLLFPLVFVKLRRNPQRLAKLLAGSILGVWVYRLVLVLADVNQGYIYEAFDTQRIT